MNTELDTLYLRWLYSHICPVSVKNPKRTYWQFAEQLYQKEFFWYVPHDDNRAEDGRTLRDEFLNWVRSDTNVDEAWLDLGCSMLELFVSMSRRLTFMTEGEARDFFWEMIRNLNVEQCNDALYTANDDLKLEVEEVMDTVIWRTYSYSGHKGGVFPLTDPQQDQRRVQLWDQMSAYIIEKEGM